MRFPLILLACFLFCDTLFAQQPPVARINFELADLKAPYVLLGCYKAGNTYRIDSVGVDTASGAFFCTKANLEPGVFFVAANGSILFDFILPAANDTFLIRGKAGDRNTLKALGSPQNEAYFIFENKRQAIEEKIIARQSMLDMVGKATQDSTALLPIKKEIDAYYSGIDSLARGFIKQYPGHLYARMLQSVRPNSPAKSVKPVLKGKVNPVYQRWMRRHYWDYTDFKDETLLNNAFWPNFFDNYFDRFVTPAPDSINKALDQVLEKMPKGGAFYRFAILHFMQNFELSDAPGADIIFVHLVDKHLQIDETPWLNVATLSRLEYKANAFRPVLTGNQAPALELPDENGRMLRLDTLTAELTMLIFYSPLCSHCMDVLPDIYQTWLDARPFGVQAVAVSTDPQYRNWQQFVRQQNWEWYDVADPSGEKPYEKKYLTNNLPVIYILDRNKRILQKRVKPDALRDVLKFYLRF